MAALSSRDALDEDVHRLIARGVTTRNHDAALGRISDGLGLKKSAVSAAFQRAAQKDLDGLNHAPLGDTTYGERALVQRCHLHEIRNVLAYLPPSKHAEARRRLLVAWGMERHEDAEAELRRTLTWLRSISASAADSLGEAFALPGGRPALGFNVIDKRLVVDPHEAETVGRIFELYLEPGGVVAFVEGEHEAIVEREV